MDPDRTGLLVTDFKHEECISRQYAAERLADIACALTAGETLELRAGGELIRVPVADEVLLKRESRSDCDRVEVELALRWSP
jgi:amphi-Trp domain-containing protein